MREITDEELTTARNKIEKTVLDEAIENAKDTDIREHRQIVRVIRRRDREEAAELLEKHLMLEGTALGQQHQKTSKEIRAPQKD
jgi:DNA-binding GntR family transcriptional regulator